jgi:hypothetical protein
MLLADTDLFLLSVEQLSRTVMWCLVFGFWNMDMEDTDELGDEENEEVLNAGFLLFACWLLVLLYGSFIAL